MSLNERSIHSSLDGSFMISETQVEKSDQSLMTLLLKRIAVVSCFFLSRVSGAPFAFA